MKDSPANSNHSKSGRMGFMIVMLLMFSTAIFITVCASNRSAGVAWGNLQDDQENKGDNAQFPAGFVVIDMSGAVANDMDLTDETIGIGPLPEEEGLSDYGYGGEVLMASSESSDFATDDVDPEVDVIAPEEEKEVRVEKESAESADKAEGAEKAKVPEGTKEVSEVVLSEVKTKWEEYTVKAGETLIDIASRYNVTVEDITKANELKNPNRLTLNQKLLIPHSPDDVEIVLEEVRTRKARLAEKQRKVKPLEVTTYTVANGDSLWSISNTFSLEIDTLFGSNDLKDPNVLKPGKQLRIPNQDGIFYTVKKGDTLDSIVKKFQISIDKVKEINESRVDLAILKIGEELFLPEARPEVSAFGSSSGKGSSSKSGATYSRSFRWPVVGRINSPFGWRRHPITRRKSFHTGIDIKASRGYRIRAAKDGQVVYSGWMGGYGRVVVLSHGQGYSTLYAHCSSLSVKKGQRVSQGQVIGLVGTSGRATGPHLHFEVRKNNSPINPLKVLR